MNGQWDGGKGSASRVSNIKAYWDCPLWKNKEDTMKKRFLFLDDVREVREAYLWDIRKPLIEVSGIPEFKWEIVRSYEEFVKYIEQFGIPDVVSFDNDLWDVAEEMVINPSNEELIKQQNKQYTQNNKELNKVKL